MCHYTEWKDTENCTHCLSTEPFLSGTYVVFDDNPDSQCCYEVSEKELHENCREMIKKEGYTFVYGTELT